MISVKDGKVVKGLGGLYEIETECEGGGVSRLLCRAKGVLKRDEEKLLIGDNVKVTIDAETPDGVVISEIIPRRNSFIRPQIANLNLLFVVFSVKKPMPVTETIDKLIAAAERNRADVALVITKSELDKSEASRLAQIYMSAGFDVFLTSSHSGEGIGELRSYIQKSISGGKCAAFAGASGVGKSTLLNALFPDMSLATAEISKKIERGRHTTRHIELFGITSEYGRGYIADTPGFSLVDFARFDFLALEDLFSAFREFAPYIGKCRYADCSHTKEGAEECALARAAMEGEISDSRLSSYRSIYEVLKSKNSYD